jgi:hypothetical protein
MKGGSMPIRGEHLTGFAIGIGVSAAGFYLYKKNQTKVNQFLGEHGINIASVFEKDRNAMTLKELILAKEELEDLIAEKEHAENEDKKSKKMKAEKN